MVITVIGTGNMARGITTRALAGSHTVTLLGHRDGEGAVPRGRPLRRGARWYRLLRNQIDIGDAIKPYSGDAAGTQLTALLHEHSIGAVALLAAAKWGDLPLIERRSRVVCQRRRDRRLPRPGEPAALVQGDDAHDDDASRRHPEAVNRLQGDYAADARDYDRIHPHIVTMSDPPHGRHRRAVPETLPLPGPRSLRPRRRQPPECPARSD
jgi:hypothetical protein